MVQLSVVSGKSAGTSLVVRRFPVRIGRSAHADLCLEEHGVWEDHLRLELRRGEGFILETAPDALAAVNGHRAQRAVLRNGDVIEIGSARIQFWLSETRQSGLRLREGLTWAAIAAISLGQVALVYWLLR
jgi:pSer/pThr/pTyr-binding forkhead associated (FHA) protein